MQKSREESGGSNEQKIEVQPEHKKTAWFLTDLGSFCVERAMGIEPTSSAWKADILADVLYPQLQKELYHNFEQLSSMNLGVANL